MTRSDAEKLYTVNPRTGRISTPGKFEGEFLFVPYLWDQCMEGDGETDEDGNVLLRIEAKDVVEFPEIPIGIGQYALLWEDETGFVYFLGSLDPFNNFSAKQRNP